MAARTLTLLLAFGLCAVLSSAATTFPATSACYFPLSASAAGSVGHSGCGSKGAAVCCTNKPPREPANSPPPAGTQCIIDASNNTYGGGCYSSPNPSGYGYAACCPVTTTPSPSPKTSPTSSPTPTTSSGSPPPPPPPPAGGQITQSRCQRVQARADEAGSFGVKGCGYTGTPYCCNKGDSTCVPDKSGSQYSGSCPTSVYPTPACCY